MKRSARFLVAMMLVVAACGGGDDAADTTTPAADGGGGTTAAPTTAAPTTTAAVVANPSDDFCEFIIAYANETDFSPMGMSAAEVEEAFSNNVDAINQAAELAPSEIRGDVVMFAEAYTGFVELLAEYDFNFLAIGAAIEDDPRLEALEDPELDAAGERIEAYCGIENFVATAPQPPDPGDTGGGGSGVVIGGTVPEGFPEQLVPPGGSVVAQTDAGGSLTVVFEIDAPTADIIEFYSEQLGDPMSTFSDPPGAMWTIFDETGLLNVVVTDTESGITNATVSVS